MTISKRVLTKWRKEALLHLERLKKESSISSEKEVSISIHYGQWIVSLNRTLALTQELIDQELLKK